MIPIQVLRRYPYFAGVPDAYLAEIASFSRQRTFKAGERLFTEGNTATHFMIVSAGEVHITYRLGDNSEVVADTLVAGDPLAWSALLDPHRLTASGLANKNGALIEIDAARLRYLCEENTNFGYVMMKEIGKTLRSRLSAMRVQAVAQIAVPA